ncbi:MAG: helix-turn-helix domain-containing protein [Clostridia bacterium]|nr:helix-turn-helix domain-containing protein [Clostridia bacterium]
MIRIQNQLTQQQLADVLGITRSAYCSYEIGRRSPDVDTLIKLSEFYKLPLVAFIEKLDNSLVGDSFKFDADEETWYLSRLTKEERALITKVRSMDDKNKKEIYDMAEGITERK